MTDLPPPRRLRDDPLVAPFADVIRLIKAGASRHRAARLTGMNFKTVYNRLRRIQELHDFPPLPDARRRPRKRVAS